jgi:hypothetical protein
MKRLVTLFTAAGAATLACLVLTSASVAAGSLPTLTLTLTKSGVTVGGSEVSGAVDVVTTVKGKVPNPEPALIRLDPGVPLSVVPQVKAMIQAHHGDFNYLDGYGSMVFNAGASEGTSSAQTVLTPGIYIALDLNGGHSGPAPFVVNQSPNPAALPTPRATVASIEFAFTGPKTLHQGELVRFENDGFLFHMIQGLGVKNAADAKKLDALLLAGKDNQAQKLATSQPVFDGGLSRGGMQQEVINEPPGYYVIACFMNSQDGREHTQLGMEETIHIVK